MVARLRARWRGRRRSVDRARANLLLLFGFLCIAIGLSYTIDSPSNAVQDGLRWATAFVPLDVWGWLWSAAGVFVAATSLHPRSRPAAAGFAAAQVLLTVWAANYFVVWLAGVSPRGWLLAVFFAVFALFAVVTSGMVGAKSVPTQRPDGQP